MAFPPFVAEPVFFFDFVDPGSLVAAHLIDAAGAAGAVEWRGFELRPPPRSMIDPRDPVWQARRTRAAVHAGELGIPMEIPHMVPWSRKAHELAELARESDCYHEVRRAIFHAHFVDRIDIGRIDLLVDIAYRAGLDRTEARIALDLDRYSGIVLEHRDSARGLEVAEVPALVAGDLRLQGLAAPEALDEWRRWIGNALTTTTGE
ncbi:MAG: DsbA family protein [Gemmatimonadota bacterium]|nr:DsbA family protein [Gemmatimonadota bacterium]MDE2873146.1 DsbA family protein [Gemmatimonadota bacterium]